MEVSEQNIGEITPHVIGLLEQWQLQPDQIVCLLGLDSQKSSSRMLRGFRSRSKSLPFSEDIGERIKHIAGISSALATTYPHYAQMRVAWLHQEHKRFGGETPLALMLLQGIDGLTRVRIEVDCAYGWSLSEEINKI